LPVNTNHTHDASCASHPDFQVNDVSLVSKKIMIIWLGY